MWCKSLAKVKQPKVTRVELRAGRGLHGPEKPGWSAAGKEKYPGNGKTSSDESNNSNNNQHHENLMEVLPRELPSSKSLRDVKKGKMTKVSIKNDYRSVIDISFSSDSFLFDGDFNIQ